MWSLPAEDSEVTNGSISAIHLITFPDILKAF